MTPAEVIVPGLAATLCVALSRFQGTSLPRAGPLLAALALPAVLAVVLRRCTAAAGV